MEQLKKNFLTILVSSILSLGFGWFLWGMQAKASNDKELAEKVQELEVNKASKREVKEMKNDCIAYTDGKIDDVMREHESSIAHVNDKLDLVIRHQSETNTLLQELIKANRQ